VERLIEELDIKLNHSEIMIKTKNETVLRKLKVKKLDVCSPLFFNEVTYILTIYQCLCT